jgi:anthraniloyl-CoA monooxygenase
VHIGVVGGGPAGLYFALLARKALPEHEVTVLERNPAGATYGWGVVFSDRTLTSFREADFKTYSQIVEKFIIWDAIDVRYRDAVVRCGGQVFSGIARKALLSLLLDRCDELGVSLELEREVGSISELEGFDLVVAADGIRSIVRDAYTDVFRPRVIHGSSRYIWFGTTRVFDSFTFAFRSNDAGFWQAHAYPFDGETSTFIVECDAETWSRAGLDELDEHGGASYCEALFEDDLRGHSLMSNNSKWINFPTLTNKTWHHRNVVLVGDAAHTAHFSIGSGTKLAMEDSIALVNALQTKPGLDEALVEYQLERKPRVERFQEAARQSQTYFETTRRFAHMDPLQFAFHLLSRSGRIDYDDLRVRDRDFVAAVDRWFAAHAAPGRPAPAAAAPPAFAPVALRSLGLRNRLAVAARPAYDSRSGDPAVEGVRAAARSGAGLVFTDVVAVSPEARITPADPGMYADDHAAAWADAVGRVHDETHAAIAITFGHAGARGSTRARTRVADVTLPLSEGWPLVAASPVAYARGGRTPVEISRDGIAALATDFASATRRALDAGFDMVELHMAHGYLLASFLSPLTNRRSDDYGGSLENRLRAPIEVADAVRAQWPDDRPLGVVLGASDWTRGGLRLGEAVDVARALREHGCDVVRVVAGQTVARHRPRYDPYWLTHYADTIRNETGLAVIATGDISTVDDANTIVAGGRADLCLLRLDAEVGTED